MRPLLLPLLVAGAYGAPQYVEPNPPQSRDWKVTVVGAARKPYSEKLFQLELQLRFEYTGPTADVAAPTIIVTDEAGAKFEPSVETRFSGDDMSQMLWLQSSIMAQQRKRRLSAGDTFGAGAPLAYEFVPLIPVTRRDLKLKFADLAPIPIAFSPSQQAPRPSPELAAGPKAGAIRVTSARRAKEYVNLGGQTARPADPSRDVVAVIELAGITTEAFQEVNVRDIFVMAGARKCAATMAEAGSVNGKPVIRVIAAVPRDVLTMELTVGNHPPVKFKAAPAVEDSIK